MIAPFSCLDFVRFPARALSLPAWSLPDSCPNHGGLAPCYGGCIFILDCCCKLQRRGVRPG